MSNWKTISDLVYTDLKGYSDLTDELSQDVDGIQPVLGHETIGTKYLVYTLNYKAPQRPTKDGVFDFDVTVTAFATNYTDVKTIADEVCNALENATNRYKPIAGETDFNDQNEYYITQIFNIKK